MSGVFGLLVFEPLGCLGLDGHGLLQDPVWGKVALHGVCMVKMEWKIRSVTSSTS